MKRIMTLKNVLCILLCVCLLMPYALTPGFATTTDTVCEHHVEHNAECQYVEAVAGHPCAHVCDEACGEVCPHEHDELCGYVESEVACGFVCAICAQHQEEVATKETQIVYTALSDCTAENHSFVGSSCEYCGIIGGVCGDAAIWTFNLDTKTLIISGDGAVTSNSWINEYRTAYSLIIEEGITELCSNAFRDMPRLNSVQLPKTLTKISSYCFASDTSLTSIDIPDSVTEIGEFAFGNTGFSTFVIPDSVTSDVHDIVSGSSLTDLYIGANSKISRSNWSDLDGVPNLQNYIVSSDNPDYSSADGVLYTKDMKILVKYPDGRAGKFSIPEGIETINAFAFYEATRLTEINIPASVKEFTDNNLGFFLIWNASSLENINVDVNNSAFSSVDGVLYNKNKTILLSCGPAKEKSVSVVDGTWEIGTRAFHKCKKLTRIDLPDSIEAIGFAAFEGCSLLESIVIPPNVMEWGQFAFKNCSSLEWIAFGVKNTRFQEDFNYCGSLTDIYYYWTEADWNTISISSYDSAVKNAKKHFNSAIPGIYSIEYYLNGGINSTENPITYYNYGDNVTLSAPARDGYVFDGWYLNNQLTEEASAPQLIRGYSSGEKAYYAKWSVDLEKHVHQFDSNCICECGAIGGKCGDDLYWAYDGQGTITITGTGAMYSYSDIYGHPETPWVEYEDDITTVVVGEGATSIGNCAFNSCDKLKEVTLPESLTKIEAHGFSFCPALEEIQLPDGLLEIGAYAFYRSGIKSIHLGEKVEMIANVNPFAGCNALQQITVDEDNPNYCAVDNVLFTGDMKKLICYPAGLTQESYTVPDGVTTIGYYGFGESQYIQNVDMPKTVTLLDTYAFSPCRSLSQINLPSSLQKIESSVFSHTGISEIIIPASVKSIGYLAFGYCSKLDSVTFEGDVPEIHSGAFGNEDSKTETNAYYPVTNPTWTEDKLQNYGGIITWIPYGDDHTEDLNKDHKCDICGEPISLCVDATNDHKCDICDETISLCADSDNDHECDICGEVIVLCVDIDHDHKCDDCQEVISLCADETSDHLCDICEKVITLCVDDNSDQKCDICQKVISLCVDNNGDHSCDTCEMVISVCEDTDDDHKCNICGEVISLCADATNDHKCDICGSDVSLCADTDNNHKCDSCGSDVSLCADNDNNHKCDICGSDVSLCADTDNNHKCDICDNDVSLCADSDNNHKCDICSKDVSLCADTDNDHKCDICGSDVSLCADNDNDHMCDSCGETISLCLDEKKNHKCDLCDKVISLCADDDNDQKCDVCGEVIILCVDDNQDHKCDICDTLISVCVDSDNDHKCDICDMVISLCADEDSDHKCDFCNETISLCTGGEATCMDAAKCDICGESYGEVNPENHTGETSVVDNAEPTCGLEGYTGDTVCECGTVIEYGESIPATGDHSYKRGSCTVCGAKDPNYKLPGVPGWVDKWWPNKGQCEHTYTSVVTDPTCTAKGYTTHTCSKCNNSYKDSYTEAQGHDWDEGEVTKEATCTKAGVMSYTCKSCSQTKDLTIKATGHEYENGVCQHCGAQAATKPSKPNWGGWFGWIGKIF